MGFDNTRWTSVGEMVADGERCGSDVPFTGGEWVEADYATHLEQQLAEAQASAELWEHRARVVADWLAGAVLAAAGSDAKRPATENPQPDVADPGVDESERQEESPE